MVEKYFEDQFDDEEVRFVFRKHPLVMRRGLIIAMLCILVGTFPVLVKPTLGFGWFFGGIGVGAVVGSVFFAPAWISWYYSVFIITSQRLIQITHRGLFHRSIVD